MSANDAAEQLSALDLNLKEIDEETAGKVFESIKGLKQVKDVVVFNTEGKALHATMDLPEKEIVELTTLYTDKKTALQKAITLKGERHEVHRFFAKEGLIYGRLGKGSKDSIGAALIKNFSNVIVLVTYGFPYLSARVLPLVRKELSKF
uniref:Profilin n=2 Tax=Vannella robusta TaxID=1487602 RepID=A0A7S4HXH0_9EUKA|mmetsp:Transcript_17199/g.21903  ORF Transcript_17199/g.21903 Transcript_17199/m.21903 type:complete len:149 (+) Transcript_17199:42-488(+)